MGSALETLCGQAVGAGQLNMLGIYIQRSWIICGVTALVLTPVYVFTSPILKLLHQSKDIADVAGKYTIWVIPQLFAYAMNFPLQKFFQSQSRVWVMTFISGAVIVIHVVLNWVFVTKLGHGLAGAALVGNISWWLIVIGQMVYLVSGSFPESWKGFSMLAFLSLSSFVKLSIASAIMLWLLRDLNPEIAVSAVSVCMNYQLWALMVALGFNVAGSVRVSNELGAGNGKSAKFSVIVTVATSAVIGVIFTAIVIATRKQLPKLFTDTPEVISESRKLGYLLAATILLNSVQPVLQGVAIGAGWQTIVAFINIGCYYIVGLPIGVILGFKFKLNAFGIWSGMLTGSVMQMIALLFVTFQTKWRREAMQSKERIRNWGGAVELQCDPILQ